MKVNVKKNTAREAVRNLVITDLAAIDALANGTGNLSGPETAAAIRLLAKAVSVLTKRCYQIVEASAQE